MPDTMMLPHLADLLGITIDELFGRQAVGCSGRISDGHDAFLIHTYAQMYGPEAGPWNLSVANKYLEYRFADFFEKHFFVPDHAQVCNIGIGAGQWDLYLSYKLRGGSLTSIDRIALCCQQLEQRLLCEGNPNDVTVICADAMDLTLAQQFDIVTMVGSTITEGKVGLSLLEKTMTFVKDGGTLYFQSLDEKVDCNAVLQAAYRHGMKLAAFFQDNAYGFSCHYYKFDRK